MSVFLWRSRIILSVRTLQAPPSKSHHHSLNGFSCYLLEVFVWKLICRDLKQMIRPWWARLLTLKVQRGVKRCCRHPGVLQNLCSSRNKIIFLTDAAAHWWFMKLWSAAASLITIKSQYDQIIEPEPNVHNVLKKDPSALIPLLDKNQVL